jgi:predicted nucleic acid-binding protein
LNSAVDTNIIVSLIGDEAPGAAAAERLLEEARIAGAVVFAAPSIPNYSLIRR